MTRITLTDTAQDMLISMAEGNIGALTVCMELLQKGPQIDPDYALGGLGFILDLDTLGLYGSEIWVLYKNVCGENLVQTCAVLRAWQLGYLTKDQICHAVDNLGKDIDSSAVLATVQDTLPAFGQPE